MTRKELIEHWKSVVLAVFTADDKVKPQWEDRLRKANEDDTIADEVCDGYLTAVATEIISKISDDEIKKMEL